MQTRSGAVILRLARFNPFTVHGTEDFNFNFHVSYFPNNVQSLLSLSCWKKLEYFHAIIITIKKRNLVSNRSIEELYKLDTNWNFSMRSVRGWIYTLSNRIYIGHFQYYSNVILISFRGWLDGMDIQRVWIFYFYFFQPSRLQPRCLRYPTIFHRRIRRYYNTFFFRNKNETFTYTHTHNLESLTSPNEIPKKEKRKRKLKFLEARPIRSSPSARVATTLEDANRVQGLLEAHSAFTTFLLTCAGTSATRGTCFVGPAGFFHTPLAPSPTIHDHTLNFSPR